MCVEQYWTAVLTHRLGGCVFGWHVLFRHCHCWLIHFPSIFQLKVTSGENLCLEMPINPFVE